MLLGCGFGLPAQYDESFLGELGDKCTLLAESESPRIVLVGGSSLAFGVDSTLLEQEFPGYRVVNFGLYAALGTQLMLELSDGQFRAGDIVILSPEQQEQTLSCYFNAESTWQALDGRFESAPPAGFLPLRGAGGAVPLLCGPQAALLPHRGEAGAGGGLPPCQL